MKKILLFIFFILLINIVSAGDIVILQENYYSGETVQAYLYNYTSNPLANIYVLEEDWANALAVHSAMLFVWPDLDFAYELVIDIHRANDNHVLADAYQGLWDRHQAGEELTREDLEEVLRGHLLQKRESFSWDCRGRGLVEERVRLRCHH